MLQLVELLLLLLVLLQLVELLLVVHQCCRVVNGGDWVRRLLLLG